MSSLPTFLLAASAAACVMFVTPADACSIQRAASNAIVISTSAGCLADASFKTAVTSTIGTSMTALQATSARAGSGGHGSAKLAELEPTPQERLRTIIYINRNEVQMRNQARGGGSRYYGQDD